MIDDCWNEHKMRVVFEFSSMKTDSNSGINICVCCFGCEKIRGYVGQNNREEISLGLNHSKH